MYHFGKRGLSRNERTKAEDKLRYLREIFDDRVTRAAGIVFVLIAALVIFNVYSDLPERYPLFGVFSFSMVPILFIVGGIVFVLAILKESRD